MAKLKDFVIPELEVQATPDQTFAVRGISFRDLMLLVDRHGPVLAALYAKLAADPEAELSPEGIQRIVSATMEEAPQLVADLIACAAGDIDDGEKVLALPLTVQIDAIEKIAILTFISEMEVKKTLERVTAMFQKVSGGVAALTTGSTTGAGGFAKT